MDGSKGSPRGRAAIVTLDLHGLGVAAARTAVAAALKRSAGVYRIRVIHGHHAGTALRDLVRTELASDPRVVRALPVDEGVTDLVLREF